MGAIIYRPGQRYIAPNARVLQSGMAAAGGWWNGNGTIPGVICAYQPKGAASLAASYINLANPGTNDAAAGVAPTFSGATGWTFNGSSQYLTTGILPTATTSMIFRFSSSSTSAFAAGSDNNTAAATRFTIATQSSTDGTKRRTGWAGLAQNGTGAYNAAGIAALCGNTTTGELYFNGVSDGTITSTWSGTGLAMYIGNRSTTTGPSAAFWAGNIQAFIAASVTLSAAQVATITTAMAAL